MNNLVVFDIETTGLDKIKDRIIQFAAVKYDVEQDKKIDSLNLYIQPEGAYVMSVTAYVKHKISPEFLKDKPYFKDVAQIIFDFILGCDLLTYNGISCDAPFLKEEFRRAGIEWSVMNHNMYDALLEERRRNGMTLGATFERYNKVSMSESGLIAHDAFADVDATYNVFKHQQNEKQYEPEKLLVEDASLEKMIFENDGKEHICFNIGKYKEMPVALIAKIDREYLLWAVSAKSNFCEKTKEYIRKYL